MSFQAGRHFRSIILLPVLAFIYLPILPPLSSPTLAKGHGKSTVEPSAENLAEGLKRFKAGDYTAAIDSFLQSIYFARNGYCPEGYFWLGQSYYEKGGQDTKGIEALKKCLQQSLKLEPEAHFTLAQLYLRNNQLDYAGTEAGLSLSQSRAKGERAKAYNLMGKVAEARGNFEEASSQYLNALGDQPWRYTDAWLNYAEVLMKQKSFEAAFEQLRNLLKSPVGLKNIPFERVYTDVGLCMFVKGNHQGALDNWRKVLEYNPDNASAHLQIAMLLDSERHLSSAITEYKEYIRLAPDEVSAQKAKDRVALLEQQLKPVPLPEKPPAPREMTAEEMAAEQERLEKGKESPNPASPSRKDSGF
jgi:tetratricopeptide (TPR) repeat protein